MNYKKALEVADALVSLIANWNDVEGNEYSGQSNNKLCLVMGDDGSGKLGTYQPFCHRRHRLSKSLEDDEVMNLQLEFSNVEELAVYLEDWCDDYEGEPSTMQEEE